jgi:hypothetical protein
MNPLSKLIYSYITNPLISDNDYLVKLDDTSKLDEFVNKIISKKKTETHHQSDPYNEATRWRTGIGGEMALEKFINKSFVDLSVGNSNDYHTPDLSKLGLKIGIKTVELGKYPIIFKKSSKPEIIILKLPDNVFSILGLASVDILNNNQDDNEILSPALKARGTKTAFTGLYGLKRFNSFEALKELYAQY